MDDQEHIDDTLQAIEKSDYAVSEEPVEVVRPSVLRDWRLEQEAAENPLQLRLDPARVRIWSGNARKQEELCESSVGDLIYAIRRDGFQNTPATVRKLWNDPEYEFEVIAGTRRHFAVSWLRQHGYPHLHFIAVVRDLDDEAAFRHQDSENRDRNDISAYERGTSYARALVTHYKGNRAHMEAALGIPKSTLTKYLAIAKLPDDIICAFASPTEIPLKGGYDLAVKLDKSDTARLAVREAAETIAREQAELLQNYRRPLPATSVMKRLLAATQSRSGRAKTTVKMSEAGRPLLTLQQVNRTGATLRLHAKSGATEDEVVRELKAVVMEMLRSQALRLA